MFNLQQFASADYWRKREERNLKSNLKKEAEYDKEIERIYKDMLDATQKEIDAFYGKYADAEGITLAEAKKRVSQLEIEAYERKAKKYVEAASQDRANTGKTNKRAFYFSKRANEEMRLYNLTMKVNRLEMLKANIGLELIKGHAELETFMSEILQGRTQEELERQAGILGKSIKNNAKTAHTIVNASFKNATFSDRLWMYHDQMKADLSKLLQSGMIQGKNSRQLAKDLRKYYYGPEYLKNGKKGAVYNTERLMRTELARVQTEAQKQAYIKEGTEEYKFMALGDACDICMAINGKSFKVKDMMPGENAPPLHPHCRCTTVSDDSKGREELDALLDFVSKGGTEADWNKFGKAAWKKGNKPVSKSKTGNTTEKKSTNIPTTVKAPNGKTYNIKEGKTVAKARKPYAKSRLESEALEWYVSGDGMWINQYLRGKGGFGTLSAEEKELISAIDRATSRQIVTNKKLYRAADAGAVFGDISYTQYDNLRNALLYGSSNKHEAAALDMANKAKGKTIDEKGFMSTTKSKDVAMGWGDYTGSDKPIIIEFDVPKGIKGKDMKEFEIEDFEQHEVLLAKNQKYEIKDIVIENSDEWGGQIVVKARLIKRR